jgi:homoserine/homoserine lactone efflux protein
MALETWITFFVATWLLCLSPGPGALAAMSSGINHGFRRGYWTVVGLQLGVLAQIVVVAIGLGALLAASHLAFEAVRWCGVAYLLWLGIQQWRAPATIGRIDEDGEPRAPARALVLKGLLVNVTNPKGTIFFVAVLPQFIDPLRPLAAQYATMAATIVAVDLVVMAGYTGLASRLVPFLRAEAHVRTLNRTVGTLFIGAALLLATFRRAPG